MANLLERASVVLTPTAYNNGEALCIKPDDASGDFQFSRNSAATRVNAQGLVENVQILSSNLVQNGDFSEEGSEEVSNGSFSQEGAELVTNGDFATDTDWTKQTGWSISGGTANCDGSQTSLSNFFQVGIVPINTFYKVTFTVTISAGGVILSIGGSNAQTTVTTSGTYTFTSRANSGDANLYFSANPDFIGSIDNVSVREVGQDWSLTDGCSIVEQGLRIVSDGAIQDAIQSNVVTNGKTYKVQYEIIEAVSGSLKIVGTFGNLSIDSTVGVHTFYGVAVDPNLKIRRNASPTDITITNISVKEVGMDWTLGGSGLNTPTIGSNSATITSVDSNSYIQQNSVLTSGKSYKISYEILSSSGSNVLKMVSSLGLATVPTTVGTHTVYGTATTTTFYIERAVIGMNATITNISIIEITDDTSLPRINYEGFSYDGSGNVVPDSGCGSWLFEPQSTNTINNSNSDFLAFNMDLVYNDVKSPDGTQNAFKATTTTTGGSQFRPNQTQITPSTFSIFLKYGNNQWYQVINSSATGFYANIDVQNGVFGTSGADTDNLSVKDYGNGWFRFSGTFTSASTTGSIRVYASSSSSAGWAGVSAPIGSYVYGYGFQVEALDYATSYIPTEGTQKTRNQDVCNNGGSLASINSTEGVLYAEIAALANDGTSRRITLSDGTASKVVMISFNNTDNQYRAYVLNGGIVFNYIGIFASLDFNKIALKFKDNDFALYVNGSKVATDLSGASPIGLNRLDFDGVNGALPFFGKTKALAVWKEALSDAELTELTTI